MPHSFEKQYKGGDDRAPLPNAPSNNKTPEAAPEGPSMRRSHDQPAFNQSPYCSPEKQKEYHKLWTSL